MAGTRLKKKLEELSEQFVLLDRTDKEAAQIFVKAFQELSFLLEKSSYEKSARATRNVSKLIENELATDGTISQKTHELASSVLSSIQAVILHGRKEREVSFPEELVSFLLPKNVDQNLFMEYLSGTLSALETVEAEVLELEKRFEPERVSELRRTIHSIKGESSLVGLNDFAEVLHLLEDFLDNLKENRPLDPILEVKDWLVFSIKKLQAGQEPEKIPAALLAKIKRRIKENKPDKPEPDERLKEAIIFSETSCDSLTGLKSSDNTSLDSQIEMQLSILSELLAEIREGDNHVISVIKGMAGTILAISSLPQQLITTLREIIHAAEVIETGSGNIENAKEKFSSALKTLRETIRRPGSSEIATEEVENEKKAESGNIIAATSTGSIPASDRPVQQSVLITEDMFGIDEFFAELPEYIQSAESALLELENDPENAELINEVFRGLHNIKGGSSFFNLKDMIKLSHEAETLLSEIRDGRVKLTSTYTTTLFETLDMLKEMVSRTKETLSGKPYETPEGFHELLKKLAYRAKVEREEIPPTLRPVEVPTFDVRESTLAAKSQEGFVRVQTERLDSLMDNVGELVIAYSMLVQEDEIQNTTNMNLTRNIARLTKIVRELQWLSMSMRMVSMKSTFQMMARVARDISQKAGVPVDFSYSGEDTEIDRNMVEELKSPLVHMVRNAVDHGIEHPEERIKAGKPPRGQIKLSAFQESGKVVIKLEDDGRGLDRDKILKKAISMGLAKSDSFLSDSDIYNFIFFEGFSTKERATEISGRGVGMDVVKKAIEKLRGTITINSEKGKGTSFTIRVPLTLAIMDGLIVRVGDEKYIVPVLSIVRSTILRKEDLTEVLDRGSLLSVQGALIPLLWLSEVFGSSSRHESSERSTVVIVEDEGRRLGLVVDDLLGKQQIVIKTLGEAMKQVQGIAGGAIMPDGTVGLVLDIAGLVRLRDTKTDFSGGELEKEPVFLN